MNSVNDFAKEFLKSLDGHSFQIDKDIADELIVAVEIIDLIKGYINQLNAKVISEGFHNQDDEIEYFKAILPQFFKLLIYYVRLADLVSAVPPGLLETSSVFDKEARRIHIFFTKYNEAYRYYRLNLSYLDDKYFVRDANDLISFHSDHLLMDVRLNTHMSLQFAKFSAYEMILNRITRGDSSGRRSIEDNTRTLNWTAQKVQLAELIYALDALKVFGNENTMFIAECMSKQWNVHTSFIHKTFEEIRLRKKNRTPFLDLLKTALMKRMEDDDDK